MFRKIIVASALGLSGLLAGCSQSDAPAQSQSSAVEQASQIYADYFEDNLKLNPVFATYIGDKRYNDQLPNFFSAEFRNQSLALQQKYLEKIQGVDASQLQDQDKLSYEIFLRDRKMSIEASKYPEHLAPIQQFYNPLNQFAVLGSGKSAQPFSNVEDYENWNARMLKLPALIDTAIKNMREGMAQKVVQPKALMVKVLPQIKAQLVGKVDDSIFYTPIKNFPESINAKDQSRLKAIYSKTIMENVLPAYRRMHQFIEKEYLPASRETYGLYALPNGNEWYNFKVRQRTTTELSADEIHNIGLSEVARIHGEMNAVMKEVDFKGDLKAFFEFTKNDPLFLFKTREEMVENYRGFRKTVDEKVPALFSSFPKADYEVRPVEEFREKSASAASYQRPAADGSRPGIFYVNTYDLSARPRWAMESLFLHEAAPGHHFQLTIQQELETLPKFRRFGGETAYIEGWGLYSETLGKELGVYQDPYQYFGALSAELWRAIRLVVDTGIHAKGWSRQEVLDYMYANAPVAEARAVSEAERFMAIPGQALAYKIGQLKIRELRDFAEKELGDKFDVKAFHAQVLKDGALPLAVLENKIQNWVKTI